MKSVMWPLRCGVLQASQTQAIHSDAPCGSQPQQFLVLLVRYGKALSPAIADCLGCQTDQQLTRMKIAVG